MFLISISFVRCNKETPQNQFRSALPDLDLIRPLAVPSSSEATGPVRKRSLPTAASSTARAAGRADPTRPRLSHAPRPAAASVYHYVRLQAALARVAD